MGGRVKTWLVISGGGAIAFVPLLKAPLHAGLSLCGVGHAETPWW